MSLKVDFGSTQFLFTLGVISVSLYFLIKWRLNYWKKRGIPGPSPSPIFGNFAKFFLSQTSHTEIFIDLYNNWKQHPIIGIFKGHMPMVVVNDLDIVKSVMIKDFNSFSTRGLVYNEEKDPLSAHLFTIDGPRWKMLRSRLSPIFTTGKLKYMIDLMLECGNVLESHLNEKIGNGNVIECRDVAAKFTTDVIGSCVFGLNMGALDREDSEFRKVGKRLFESSYWTIFKRNLRDASPELFTLFKLRAFDKESCEFFYDTFWNTVKFRERENISRPDLVDLLMDVKKNYDSKEFELTDGLLAAQAFVFFAAGFETSSATISFALYELAQQPNLQEKLRDEILKILKKHDGKLSYDIVREMTYLDMVFNETLRKNPPVTVLERFTTRPYPVPGTNITLEKGRKVLIPIYGFQHDAQYFPNPEIFDPDRFLPEVKNQRHPMAFLPFGDGPKNCIGIRFAVFQVKLGLITVLKNYRVSTVPQTAIPFEIDRGTFLLTPKTGIELKFEPIS